MRPKGTKLELAIPYGVAMALHDMGRSIRHVVCQREALPRTKSSHTTLVHWQHTKAR